MNIKGAIFDLDGTLLDSMYVWDKVGTKYMASQGIEVGEEFEQSIKDMSMSQCADYILSEYGVKTTAGEIRSCVNKIVEKMYFYDVMPKPGVPQLLEKLKSSGALMCVATATDRHLAEAALRRCGLLDYFSDIFTCTSVGAGKDSPLIYEKALALLGTKKSETPVFEDALYAIETAKAAGFTVAAVKDSFSLSKQTEIRELADFYIEDYQDFLETQLN